MVTCCFCMYSLIGHNPTASITSTNGGYSHFPSSARRSIILTFLWAALWWDLSNTFNIVPIANQTPLPYRSPICATSLYNTQRDCTIDPIFVNNFEIIPQRHQSFLRLWYTAAQLLLWYVIMRPMYGKSYSSSRVPVLSWMETCLVSKQCFWVSLQIRLASLSKHVYDS